MFILIMWDKFETYSKSSYTWKCTLTARLVFTLLIKNRALKVHVRNAAENSTIISFTLRFTHQVRLISWMLDNCDLGEHFLQQKMKRKVHQKLRQLIWKTCQIRMKVREISNNHTWFYGNTCFWTFVACKKSNSCFLNFLKLSKKNK